MAYDPMEVLLDGLRTDERLVQAEAARLLGELRSPRAVGPLVDYVRHARWHAKTAGFHALAQIGDRSVCDAIRHLVDNPNCSDDWYWYGCRSVRAAAAIALLALGDQTGAGYLHELADRDDNVFYAWFAPAILRLPDDPPAAVRLKARLTVGRVCGEDAAPVRRTEPGALTMAAEALGLLGGAEACERLMELLSFRSRYVRGQAAVSLLSCSTADEHLTAVAELAESDPTDFARIRAAQALCAAGRMEYAEQVRSAVERCADPFDRAVALQVLGSLGRAEDRDLVLGMLSHPDGYVRQCAVEALERIGDAPETALAACRKDPDVRVRMQTAKYDLAREGGCIQ